MFVDWDISHTSKYTQDKKGWNLEQKFKVRQSELINVAPMFTLGAD